MVDSEEFRKGLRAFSTGVAVISVKQGDTFHGMTASSFAAVSVDPQLVLFSVARTARAHPLLQSAERFGINLLQSDQAELGHYFAGRRGTRLEIGCDWIEGCPILRRTLGYFVCRKWAQYPGGDHDIFVGEVLALGRSDAPALVCSRGIFHHLGPEITPPTNGQVTRTDCIETALGAASCDM
ncbi:flavin reductase family protein [Pusillimonas noertemannii]|uniref:Flavin reductase (DIM6/NTAB) family NADH-FMN oxidoreductase RutF n=1 Tax=Pusillimonas noertemannii TaxID=305977 RepID=A0A2U1CJQ8_9BURK|nr:flavin reductase family protein [Pusillimonas noertemannii]PVY61250.1 flavin reductase (DIM6/NTAB) family NADH-FMN oxidoreductase RutF [Pusillimonas noertemannii]TFL09127.1 flavin reductase [Pusillimonas noertemannii]